MTSVLIVEDEESLADPLAFLLRKEGFEATVVTDGPSALAEFDRAGADIVLLDLMLPGMSGTDVCKQLRTRSSVPVIMVTARDSEIDKVVGLELGADDYVTKPYSARELIARIRAVLRRGGDDDSEVTDGVLESGPVRMDVERHVVSVNGEAITLPLKEFDLLEYLMRNSGRVLTRGQLIDWVWGADYVGDTKTLDVHVKRLRSKIEAAPANPIHLVTARGLGYKLEGYTACTAPTTSSATASASAMIDTCGFTSGQLGRIDASATQTPSMPRRFPVLSTGHRCSSAPAAAVPVGWKAAKCTLLGWLRRNASRSA